MQRGQINFNWRSSLKPRTFLLENLIFIEFEVGSLFSHEQIINRYRRKRPKVDATIFDSALSHTRRSDASEKEKKIACPLLDVFTCGQVSSPRLNRLIIVHFVTTKDYPRIC